MTPVRVEEPAGEPDGLRKLTTDDSQNEPPDFDANDGFDDEPGVAQSANADMAWPEAISDGLTLPCADCGQVPRFDYHVRQEFWARWVPGLERLGVVCLPCLDRRCGGVGLAGALEEIQWTGTGHTVVLKPTFRHEYETWTCAWCGQENSPSCARCSHFGALPVPVGDETEALRSELGQWKDDFSRKERGYNAWKELCHAARRERDEALARVAGLEARAQEAEKLVVGLEAVEAVLREREQLWFAEAKAQTDRAAGLEAREAALTDALNAARALHERVEIDESVGICLSERVSSLRLGAALAALADSGEAGS